MPFNLKVPKAFKQWKVKIYDKELLIEEPHLTIVFKLKRWRYGLRTRDFLDTNPDPKVIPPGIMDLVNKQYEKLCIEWDKRFPMNPVLPDKKEG